MRKILATVSASSFVCWSVGLIFLWIGRDRTVWSGIHWIGLVLFSVGVLLLMFSSMLYLSRLIQINQKLYQQGINPRVLNPFRRIERGSPYGREVWLQRSLLLIIPGLILLSLFIHAIIQMIPTINLLPLPEQGDIGIYMLLTVYLGFPLTMLLYAFASKDIADVSGKEEREEFLEP